ncbi:hypothetical protein LZG74_11960 [Dyadobacter sp. CY327]|uniref:lipopolysaccharide biosynthesis protein n=1 Tax=Dyadobacter sp. CY327 TaxID=2907301 RepID=UPI001F260D39|nr:hypothetical protein [Dyadobacter sp. CY327]MCE7071023.1 hypothetical protein [Dyadobacter sp. CY327]
MSTAKRLISGTVASWASILVTMLTQVALVPIFLTYWDIKTYGIWIAIQALVNVLSTLDRGHNDFLEYEFLKLGPEHRPKIAFNLWSGIRIAAIVSFIELLLVYLLSMHIDMNFLFGEDSSDSLNLRSEIGWAIVIQWIGWSLTNLLGLFFRALSAFGYYPRMGWWNVLLAMVTSFIPVLFVINGANLLQASAGAIGGVVVLLGFQLADILRLLRKEGIASGDYSFKQGFQNFGVSMTLSGRYFLDNFKQQGVRLLMAPLTGAAGVAAFSTIRTVANVTQQGLLTVTHPLLPELMRFLREKNQQKMEVSFGTVWFVLIGLLAPGVLILQCIAPALFSVWTKGQIEFDPILLAALSTGVLFFALAQPAMAVTVGNNLLKVQILISFISSLVVVGGILLLVPYLHILGAGIALLMAEIVAAIGFLHYAKIWLKENGLIWPAKASGIATASVYIAALSMSLMIVFPQYQWASLIIGLLLLCLNIWRYWNSLSLQINDRIQSMLARLPIINKLLGKSKPLSQS